MIKKLFALLFIFLASCASRSPIRQLEEDLAAVLERPTEPVQAGLRSDLFTIELPEGIVGSISIDWITRTNATQYNASTWLSQGFKGVRFVGKGVGRTIIRCTSWDGNTIAIKRHNGTVMFEDCTIEAGYSTAIHAGEQNLNKIPHPDFKVVLIDVEGYVPPPTSDGRTKWWYFAYNCDNLFRRVKIDARHAAEHASYTHGYAAGGANDRVASLWEDCFVQAGAQCDKVRSDKTETAWAGRGIWEIRRRCEMVDWYQPHSDRGGAAHVREGAATNQYYERCLWRGGDAIGSLTAANRARTVMVTSEPLSYDIQSGQVDKQGGFGNGWIVMVECASDGGPGPSWYAPMARVGKEAGVMWAARGVLVERCGLWGDHLSFQMDTLPAGSALFRNNNTPAIKQWCAANGFDTRVEASIITSQRAIPISEGYSR